MDLFKKQTTQFPVAYSEIMQRIRNIDPVNYRASRNYINGAVSYLSPYISRGVISTKFVFNELLKKGYKPVQIEKFIQELAWRDYWQQVWIAKGTAINDDLKHTQIEISTKGYTCARGGRLHSSIQSGPVCARGGEGFTCPSRGKLWLTVYRAHAS